MQKFFSSLFLALSIVFLFSIFAIPVKAFCDGQVDWHLTCSVCQANGKEFVTGGNGICAANGSLVPLNEYNGPIEQKCNAIPSICQPAPPPPPVCTPNASQKCVGNAVYWYDSCGVLGNFVKNCTANQTCNNGVCNNNPPPPPPPAICSKNSDCGTNDLSLPFCNTNKVFKTATTFTCNNPGTQNASCSTSTTQQLQQDCGLTQVCVIETATCQAKASATIIIKKTTVGGDDTFSYFLTPTPQVIKVTTANNANTSGPIKIDPGTYTVTEADQDGWAITGASCKDSKNTPKGTLFGKSIKDISITANEVITCTFTNGKYPTLTINKILIPATDNAKFIILIDGNSFAGKLGNGGTTGPKAMIPGTYTISESGADGVDANNYTATMSGACNAVGKISLAYGDSPKTCTITNQKIEGSLVINKETIGGDGKFNINISGGPATTATPPNVELETKNGKDSIEVTADPGTYNLLEDQQDGWNITDASCVIEGEEPFNKNDTNGIKGVVIKPGKTTECTFKNTIKPGILIIRKRILNYLAFPNDTAPIFNYTITGGPQTGSITPNGVILDARVTTNSDNLQASPGTYRITEAMPINWLLSTIVCTTAGGTTISKNITNGVNGIPIEAGKTTTCVFTNTKGAPTLTIIKRAIGGDGVGTFNYTIQRSGAPNIIPPPLITVNGNGRLNPITLEASKDQSLIYSITETSQDPSWKFDSVVCDKGSPVTGPNGISSLQVNPGDNITCTFTNKKAPGTLIINENAVGGNATFAYTISGGFVIPPINTANSNTTGPLSFLPGAYNLSQVIPNGWNLDSASCTISSGGTITKNTVTGINGISIVSGQTTTCSFTNSKFGTLKIVKKTVGGDARFNFVVGVLGSNSTLPVAITTTDGTGEEILNTIIPASHYAIAEVPTNQSLSSFVTSNGFEVPQNIVYPFEISPSWNLTSASCTGQGNSISEFTIPPGGTVTCTFINIKPAAKIIINKTTEQSSDKNTFSFAITPTPIGLIEIPTQGSNGSSGVININTGNYSIIETEEPGWYTRTASCTLNNAPIGIFNAPDQSVRNIAIQNGQTVICNFVNSRRATLTVNKTISPTNDPGKFILKIDDVAKTPASGVGNGGTTGPIFLSPGTHTISEVAVQGTTLSDYTSLITGEGCSNSGIITLLSGENKVCTIVNSKAANGTLILTKNTIGGNGTFTFSLGGGNGLPQDVQSITTINGTSTKTFTTIKPGSNFSITETEAAGWRLDSAGCTGSIIGNTGVKLNQTIGNITISPGETVTCAFTSTTQATLKIIKQTTTNANQNTQFNYTISPTPK